MQLEYSSLEQPTNSFAFYLSLRFQALIWACLDADLVKSAAFYAERYYALDNRDHNAGHLYAIALLRCGQVHNAMSLVNLPADIRCCGCSEIKAKCCMALGRHRQARQALEETLGGLFPNLANSSTRSREVLTFPETSVLHCRAGYSSLQGNLHDQAASHFRQALALNPLLWEAFEGLCSVGQFPEIEELFPFKPPSTKQRTQEGMPGASHMSFQPTQLPPQSTSSLFTPDVFGSQATSQSFRMAGLRDSIATNDSSFLPGDNSMLHLQLRTAGIPTATSSLVSRPLSSAEEEGPVQKKPRSVSRPPDDTRKRQLSSIETRSRKRPPPNNNKTNKNDVATATLGGRRNTRLPMAGPKKYQLPQDRRRPPIHSRGPSIESEIDEDFATFESAHSPSPSSIAQSPRSEGSPPPNLFPQSNDLKAAEKHEISLADSYIYELMRVFASASRAMAMYDCPSCLDELNKIPEVHQRSAWVMVMAGRAHYEMVDYVKAERAFQAARNLEPYRTWDMEVYSTLLWHLQRNVELSFLAQELINVDPRSSQAWIAVGNCFSLEKEKSQAMTCFRRAAQLDPSCAYAYTLSGHESMDDDLEKAISFFQSALRVDPRHYNAWYGLGTCYLRMSKIKLAEYHYRRAAEVHPSNAVLLGCLGMALERKGDTEGAFALFNDAVRLAPDNALVRYRRAKILIAMKKYRAAVEDLTQLRDSSPEESNVVFQLARVYRLMGNETKSAQMLAIARDMSPKSISKIKKLLETSKDKKAEDEMDEG